MNSSTVGAHASSATSQAWRVVGRSPRRLRVLAMIALAAVFFGVGAVPGVAGAQTAARRPVPAGEVTGLDMGIDGTLEAVPGGTVRWFVTVYEVVGQRNLRPAAAATLSATASFAPSENIATVVTDAQGRAGLDIPIPDDVGGAIELRVEATSRGSVRRVFSVSLQVAPRYRLLLLTDRSVSAPGGTVMAFGRLLDRATGRPVEGAVVTTQLSNPVAQDAPTASPAPATTDVNGVFSSAVPLGPGLGAVGISATARVGGTSASSGGRPLRSRAPQGPVATVTASAVVTVAVAQGRALWATATPNRAVVAPGQELGAGVRVFAPNGRPLAGARVRVRRPRDPDPGRRVDSVETDGEGEVTLRTRVPRRVAGSQWTQVFEVVHPAYGATTATLVVQVERAPYFVGASVAGGGLVPELPGQVLARIVAPDGTPFAGREVRLEAPRLGGTLRATTDSDGVASFTGRVSLNSGDDACGGATAAAATLVADTHRQALCLPVDLDGALSVSAPLVTGPADAVSVTVVRRPEIARRPVEVALLVKRTGRWLPVSRTTIGPRVAQASVDLPDWVRGEVWVRARPILDGGVPGRGGSTLVYRGAVPAALAVEANGLGARVVPSSAPAPGATTLLFAVDGGLSESFGGVVAGGRGPLEAALLAHHTPAHLLAIAGSHTPRDDTASAVLRGGQVTTLSMPEAPTAQGLLRDPWRTRARFIRGRVGRLMRGVEAYVAQQAPGQMDDVAAVRRGRFHFNASILEASAAEAGFGEEGTAGLGGEPLEIASLTSLDAAFTFDNVARRITRERLFRLLVLLRDHIHSRGLDRPWARRGDPAEYLTTLLDGESGFAHEWPEGGHLYDAWGRPFVLRRARGASRFTFLEPLPGWELVSAGPDGRAGTGDDMVDPFARVLPSAGLYAEAVGEDVLLARIRGVALGRATVASLAEVFEVQVPDLFPEEEAAAPAAFSRLPQLSAPLAAARGQRLPAPHLGAVYGGVGPRQSYRLPDERRAYRAVAVSFRGDGSVDVGATSFEAGMPFSVRVPWPEALRPGERLTFPVELVQHGEGAEPRIEVLGGGDIVRASLTPEGVALEALRPGIAQLILRATMADGAVARHRHRLRVVPPGSLRVRHAAAFGDGHARVALEVPDGAAPWRGQLVVGAPQAIAADPMLRGAFAEHPAIAAWAGTLSGAGDSRLAEPLADYLALVDAQAGAAGEGLPSDIDRACALVAWAARADGRGAGQFGRLSQAFRASMTGDLRIRAAVLTALATAAPRVPTGGGYDPIVAVINGLREDGWRALATAAGEPAVMARMAAALLTVDEADAPGRALYLRARASLEADGQGHRSVPGGAQHPADAFAGTFALALAARQVGDDDLADELRGSAIRLLNRVPRLGAEGAFWSVAASVLGAFGVGGPAAVEVRVDGESRRVELGDDGVATLDVDPGAAVVVHGEGPVWVRSESRYLVPAANRARGAVRARIEGASGDAQGRAGFEVAVTNRGRGRVRRPVVEVVVPGAGRLDEAGRAMMEAAGGVRRVTGPDGAGVIRIWLRAMRRGEERRVALPILWTGHGRTRGLGTSSYDAAVPWRVSTTMGRALRVDGRTE